MNKFMKGALTTVIAVTLGTGMSACNRHASAEGPQYAKVLSATPIHKTYNHPTKSCREETVTHHKPVKDSHQVAGTAIGAVVGGLAGHQVGGGRGKTLATVAGAVAGGYAGKKIQEKRQEDSTYTTQEQKCQTVNHRSTKVVGYTVKYQLPDGTVQTTRMDHDPGDRVEIKKSTTVVSTQ
jgi:uncharacterized protein YcfJ